MKTHTMKNTIKTAVFENIGPAEAVDYLIKNTCNRPLQAHNIRYIADEMLNERWIFNGDTIVFDWDNILRQGQHRLHGILKAGATHEFLVVRGIDPAAFSTMDCGKGRNGSDALSLIGETNTKTRASALTWIEKYYTMVEEGNFALTGIRKKVSPTLTLELNNKYSDFNSIIDKRQNRLGCNVINSVSNYIFSKIDSQLASEFHEKVVHGENLSSRDPEFLLRNRLIANQVSKSKLSNEYIFALFIKAWNAKRSGVTLKTLRHTECGSTASQFPVAI